MAMNPLLFKLGNGAYYANQAADASTKQQMQQLLLQQALQQQQGTKLAGQLFPNMFDGSGNGGSPQLPGATKLPWTGGAPAAPAPGGLPPGGAPPMPNAQPAGPMPPQMSGNTPPAGAAQPPQMGGPQPTNGLSWQQLATAIKRQAPDADGATIFQVVQQYAPMMNQQSKQDVALMQMMVKSAIADESNKTKVETTGMQQAGANSRNANTVTGANSRNANTVGAAGGLDTKKAKTAVDVAKANLLNLRSNNAPPDQIAAAQKQLDTAMAAYQSSGARKSSGAAQMVTVVSPDGIAGTIPADQLQDALKQGYKQQ